MKIGLRLGVLCGCECVCVWCEGGGGRGRGRGGVGFVISIFICLPALGFLCI